MAFGSRLGDLAGQDIVLWREAGLDPMTGGAAVPVRTTLFATAAAWLVRSCRRWMQNAVFGRDIVHSGRASPSHADPESSIHG